MLKHIILSLVLLCSLFFPADSRCDNPKREFRGAWLSSIYQNFNKMSTDQLKRRLTTVLNNLQEAGCNAVIFQVRPSADALYESDLEPWSEWLTGKRGRAPQPYWDPMQFMIEEAHKRGMEFHAWLNPYRVTISSKEVLPADHPSKKYPERFFRHNGQVLFDPAYQENIDFICDVIADILENYDVDGIHFDDYFYPYPDSQGRKFDGDAASYAKFGKGMNKADWRRSNVDRLIEEVHETIQDIKPWVRFGISPFGIHRNKKTDPSGSATSGLQNYDDLYSDVLLWARNGWIDYVAPQLYWNLDHKAASTRELAPWWDKNVKGAHLYFGQDVQRSMDAGELDKKMDIERNLGNVGGHIWWTGYWVADNYKGASAKLKDKYQSTLALPPAYGDPSYHPAKPEGLKLDAAGKDYILSWKASSTGEREEETDVVKHVVYQFYPDEQIDLEDASTIILVTQSNRVKISGDDLEKGSVLVVTALDRMNRESMASTIKFK